MPKEKQTIEVNPDNGRLIFKEFSTIPSVFTEKASDREAPDTLPKEIYPSLWAITSDTVTQNSTLYPAKELAGSFDDKTGIYSWVNPYEKPFISGHNEYSSPVHGRVVMARMQKEGKDKYLNLIARVTSQEAIQKILNGEMYTLSIGVEVEDAECSICGQKQREDGYCDHYRGYSYPVKNSSGKVEQQLCYYSMSGIRGREISEVIVPSDVNAHIRVADMGKDAVTKLGKSSSVAVASESYAPTIESRPKNYFISFKNTKDSGTLSFSEAFNGEVSKEFSKEKGKIPMSTKTESTETFDEIELPELNSVEGIVSSVTLLSQAKEAGKKINPEILTRVSEAYTHTGLSDDFCIRLELGEGKGVALLPKTEAESILTKEFVQEEQVSFTPQELLTLVENKSKELDTVNKTIELKNQKIADLEKTMSESADVTKYTEMVGKVTVLTQELSEEKTATHNILVGVVASEMTRQGHKIAMSRSSEELKDYLGKRSSESLLDTYTDLLEAENSNPIVKAKNPLTEKSNKSVSQQLKDLLKTSDSNVESVKVETNAGTLEGTLTETKEEKVTLTFEDGMLTIAPLAKEDDSSEFSLEGLE